MMGKYFLAILLIFVFSAPGKADPASPYPHQQKNHRTVACASCHVLIGSAFEVKSLPNHAACASCHNFAGESMDRFKSFCGICHKNKDISAEHPSLFARSERGGLHEFASLFLHRNHLKTAGTNNALCLDCHPVASLDQTNVRVPMSHSACFACHTDQREPAPSRAQCAGCHKILRPDSETEPPVGFVHSDHVFDTRPVRKKDLAGRRPDYLCQECHLPLLSADRMRIRSWQNKEYCIQCHNGKPGLPGRLKDEG